MKEHQFKIALCIGLFFICQIAASQHSSFKQKVLLIKESNIPEFVAGIKEGDTDLKYFLPFLLHYKGQFRKSEEAFIRIVEENVNDSDYIKETINLRTANLLHLSLYRELVRFIDSLSNVLPQFVNEDILNTRKIAFALKDEPPLAIEAPEKDTLKIKKDMAGLLRIPVGLGNETENFIFDTGANFSVISGSNARKYHLSFSADTILVGTATGKKVKAFIAIAPELNISNIKLYNVLFLVLPDEALSFFGGLYKIEGIFGLDVMRLFGYIEIISTTKMIINKSSNATAGRNMYFDGFALVAEVSFNEHERLAFFIDFGGKETSLNQKSASFFDLSTLKEVKKNVTGAGGASIFNTYKVPAVQLTVGNVNIQMKNISLFTNIATGPKSKYFGTIGMNLITEMKSVILDFENGEILFRN